MEGLLPLELYDIKSVNGRYFIIVSVWIEFMLPLLTLRNYSKFVVDYLKSLLKLHNVVALGKVAKSQDGSR